ncbi:hypothetical protein DFH09DRAFT_1155153 [Mycena vulgaris]|nr:hypothetical protein DFH09DRAFT_1155153 [Mycena vulgaris]
MKSLIPTPVIHTPKPPPSLVLPAHLIATASNTYASDDTSLRNVACRIMDYLCFFLFAALDTLLRPCSGSPSPSISLHLHPVRWLVTDGHFPGIRINLRINQTPNLCSSRGLRAHESLLIVDGDELNHLAIIGHLRSRVSLQNKGASTTTGSWARVAGGGGKGRDDTKDMMCWHFGKIRWTGPDTG